MSLSRKAILVIVIILVIDQVSKILIKTNMVYAQTIPVLGNWFLIRFIENPGMAFGIDFPFRFGKMALSLFRIVAIGAIAWYLRGLIQKKAPTGVVICLSLILAGAIGNILDSCFYGMIFSKSNYIEPASFVPIGQGYSSFLHGEVVDMLYFELFRGHYPTWFPLKGGQDFVFFRPIFNIADSAISVGVMIILIFQRKYFQNL